MRTAKASVKNPPARIHPYLLLLAVALLAITVLALAWPRLQASLHYLPVERAIERYWLEGSIAADRMQGLQQRALESAETHSHQRYWEGLNLLYFVQANDDNASLHQRRSAFEQSIEAADRSLALAPVQPRLWLRKAHALNWLSFNPQQALTALKMSIYTGRVEPMLLLSRLYLGYSRMPAMDKESKNLLRDQTLLAWQMRRSEMVRALKRDELTMVRIRSLLENTHPDVLADMEEALAGRIR